MVIPNKRRTPIRRERIETAEGGPTGGGAWMRRRTQSGLFVGAILTERAGFPAILRCEARPCASPFGPAFGRPNPFRTHSSRSLAWNDQAALTPPGPAGKPAPSWWCESISASLGDRADSEPRALPG